MRAVEQHNHLQQIGIPAGGIIDLEAEAVDGDPAAFPNGQT
jgi:hypothetical protein